MSEQEHIPERDFADSNLPQARVPATLENINGGEPNLLPVAAADQPLRIEIDIWPNSNPALGAETLTLFWDGSEVGRRTWSEPVPIPEDELVFFIPRNRMTEGTHVISYEVHLSVIGDTTPSDPITITIDRSAPSFPNPGSMAFPAEVVRDGLTAAYLETHGDRVEASVALYADQRPGDQIVWYWGETPSSELQAGSQQFFLEDINRPIVLPIDGDTVRARGDGTRYAHYHLRDRAGNASGLSPSVSLRVAAQPIQRNLPWPIVVEATGIGENIALDPLEGRASGVTVEIPQEAVFGPEDQIWVQWAENGTVGAFRTKDPIAPGSRRYNVPREYIAAHIGKSDIPVYYDAIETNGTVHPSFRCKMQVLTIAVNRFPTIQCVEAIGYPNLSLARVDAIGARLTLAPWVLITANQHVRIRAEGLTQEGAPTNTTVLDRQITASEVTAGLGRSGDVRIDRNFLNTLRRHTQFTIWVTVSFDNGLTWPPAPNFPKLSLTLVD
ncbi:hypothetical protein [Mesorhizobium retamae]|uniref:Ig-like domain-containing protein n=1 Tax=Mesorhizobium retamae TaxID=2912854 RepID=A0ABS9QNG5_9HYPH|nr:hypothetical protein [Mesorhizobium sp. IRAMC:0171]MCG7508985.1 hypothetical protein [Mesorhizobium sp. IRAMC:0171]